MKTTFCKTSCLLLLLFSTAAVAFGVCADSSATESVVINGVRWATRNVAEPGTFAANPEDAGMFYQWNRKTARAVTGSVTSWDNSYPTGIEWEKANDPCPAGYRVPTLQDQASLLDKPKVTNEWTTRNGVAGRKFIDIATGNSIFFPAAGYRYSYDGALNSAGEYGYYWSSTEGGSSLAYGLYFNSSNAGVNYGYRTGGQSVRCVAE